MLISTYANQLTPSDLQRVLDALRRGEVVIYPTDSVYAFGCDAANKAAVEEICRLRHKDAKRPTLSIVCADIAQVRSFALFSDDTFKLMRRYLPGPYTFILEVGSHLPKIYRAGRRTVGVRIVSNPVAMQLVEAFGAPLMTASLRTNSGEEIEYMTDPSLIEERYGREVAMVVDGGVGGLVPSTIVDCTGDEPEVLRGSLEPNGESL